MKYSIHEKEDYYGYIYITLDQRHNKIYVGQKKGKIEKSKDYFGSGTIIKKIIKKYKTYFLKKTVLGVCYSKEELTFWETECKYFFNAFNRNYGYNIIEKDTGGDTFTNSPFKEERREKNRISATGRLHTEEWCINHSIILTGRKYSLNHRQNISKGLSGKSKGKGVLKSEKHKSNMSKNRIDKGLSRGKNNPHYIKLDYEFLIKKYFNGIGRLELIQEYNNNHENKIGTLKKFLSIFDLPTNTLSHNYSKQKRIYLKFIEENKYRINWYLENCDYLEEIYYSSRRF